MSEKLLVDMIERLQEASSDHQKELVRVATTMSIEIPDIKTKLASSEARLQALETNVASITTTVVSMNSMVEDMKPIIQFFKFVKWCIIGGALILGWIGSHATGLWEFIEKLFRH